MKLRIPYGPVSVISLHVGWMLMAIGVVLFLLGDGFYQAVVGEFFRTFPKWLFCLIMVTSGIGVAKPGIERRFAKHLYGAFACWLWIGVCVWPLFTGSNTPLAVIGTLIWLCFSSLLVHDAFSPTYDKNFNEYR
jgi:hypothetical protein